MNPGNTSLIDQKPYFIHEDTGALQSLVTLRVKVKHGGGYPRPEAHILLPTPGCLHL